MEGGEDGLCGKGREQRYQGRGSRELGTPLTHPLCRPLHSPTPVIACIHPRLAPQALQSRGYQRLVLQVGRGSLPQPGSSSALAVEVFRFKDSLAEELQSADLVISHAGTAPAAPWGCGRSLG